MEMTIKCFNQKCRNWFVITAKEKWPNRKFCCKKCRKEGNSAWHKEEKRLHRIETAEVFMCPHCGQPTPRLNDRQKSCHKKRCKLEERRIRDRGYKARERAEWEKSKSRYDRSGRRPCLLCEKDFFSPDKTKITFCSKCRPLFASRQEEWRFAPEGW